MKRINEIIKQNKKAVYSVLGVLCIVVVVFIVLAITSNRTTLKLKTDTLTVEYGKEVSTKANDYLTNNKDILKEVKVVSTIKNEENKDYPSLGKYEITLQYKKEKTVVKVEVKDTTKPTFNDCNSVEFVKGTDFNYAEFIKAEDLQEVTYDFDTSKVNKDNVGEYTVKVTATDKSNNKAEKEIKVKVLDIDTTNNDVQTSVNENGDVVVNVAEKPKETTNNTSSNSTSNTTSNNTNTNNTNSSNNTNNSESSSNDSSSNSNTPNATPTPPQAETPHQHYSNFISPLFNTQAECDKWGEDYLLSDENFYNTKYSGYASQRCSCGKFGVFYFY